MPADRTLLPLRPAVLHILLALSNGALHGLGIANEIERTSEGIVELGPGTLYRSLAEMSDAGWIEGVPAPTEDADPRRKYYALTSDGLALLAAEAARLQRLVEHARARRVLPERA